MGGAPLAHCALLTEKVISPVQNQHQKSWHTNLGRLLIPHSSRPGSVTNSEVISHIATVCYRSKFNDRSVSRF